MKALSMEQEELFKALQQYVEKIALQPGAKLESETVLAQKFSVSRYRIRQVLERLRQMGILDRVKRRGSVVKNVDQMALSNNLSMQMHVAGFNQDEYNEARLVLEMGIVPLVCKRQTPALIGSLQDEINAIRSTSNDALLADEHLKNFHIILIQGCGNRVLQTLSSIVVKYFDSTHNLIANAPADYFLQAADELQEIVVALKMKNIRKTAQLLTQYLKKHSEFNLKS